MGAAMGNEDGFLFCLCKLLDYCKQDLSEVCSVFICSFLVNQAYFEHRQE